MFSGPRVAGVAARGASAAVVTYGAVGTEGGGLELRSAGGFEACLWHMVYEEELGTVTSWLS